MRWLGGARTLCVIVTGSLCAMPGCAAEDAGRPGPRASVAAPCTVLDLDGNAVELWTTLPAPVTVVVFTRTDCPVSNRFAPVIRGLYETYHPRGVAFFLVYVDPDEPPDAIRAHLKEYGYPCPGLRDPSHALVARCGATITPEAAVFDIHGAITYRGRINDLYADLGQPRPQATTRDLEDAIDSTARARPVAAPRTRAVGCLISDLAH